MQDFNGAVKDYDNAIKADPEFGDAYYNRGMFLLYMKEKLNACADFSKAGELGMTESYSVIKKYCPHVLVK
jgi:tetratricopeptide (TPR) repeat protein